MAAVAVAVVSLVISTDQKRAAAKLQRQGIAETRRQNALSQRKADISSARDRVNLVRRARIARATVQSSAENSGAGLGSGVAGGIASIGSQVSSNLGFVNQISSINQDITASRNTEASALSSASRAQALGGVADSVFSLAASRA